ncbi:ACP S-malonyltransferase [Marinactinospora thermotolerans]|uniref:ACP S-malonyltransferase n=1 Tax=Marinactinospora thermotolerans TaxID=531310 RepID=UPI000999EEB8|nr:ACP S-malonyltransferase [Marinactinospora thermotolerans]
MAFRGGGTPCPVAPAGEGSVATEIAFVFPGQGSQSPGMGADLLERSPSLRRALRLAEEITRSDLTGAMLHGPAERLGATVTTQATVFAVSVAVAELAAERGFRPAAVAGHSLGEFSALVAGGWLDLASATRAVVLRAQAMERCCVSSPGAMAAVIGLDVERVAPLLPSGSDVVVANVNGPGQVVLSGPSAEVSSLEEPLLAAGAAGYQRLPVAGAFHSPLMAAAQQEFAPVVDTLPLRPGHTPMVSSITGGLVEDVDTYRELLRGQITAPVQWERTATTLLRLCPDGAVEMGPGRVLRGLLRRVDRSWPVANCRAWPDLPALAHRFGTDPATRLPVG